MSEDAPGNSRSSLLPIVHHRSLHVDHVGRHWRAVHSAGMDAHGPPHIIPLVLVPHLRLALMDHGGGQRHWHLHGPLVVGRHLGVVVHGHGQRWLAGVGPVRGLAGAKGSGDVLRSGVFGARWCAVVGIADGHVRRARAVICTAVGQLSLSRRLEATWRERTLLVRWWCGGLGGVYVAGAGILWHL